MLSLLHFTSQLSSYARGHFDHQYDQTFVPGAERKFGRLFNVNTEPTHPTAPFRLLS